MREAVVVGRAHASSHRRLMEDDMIDPLEQIQPWVCFYERGQFAVLDSLKRHSGRSVPGVFFLPPSAAAILIVDGIWQQVNNQLGTSLDRGEEEELASTQLQTIANMVAEAADAYASGRIERCVGMWAGNEVWASMDSEELRRLLDHLAEYFREQGTAGRSIVASL